MNSIRVKVNGSLRRFMDESGMPYECERVIEESGVKAVEIIADLGLPLHMVEAVFCNGRVINIYDKVKPGDRLALFPFGTPGPYRVFLGMLRENLRRKRIEGVDN